MMVELHMRQPRARVLQTGRWSVHLNPRYRRNSRSLKFVMSFRRKLEVLLKTLRTGPNPMKARILVSGM